MYSKAHPYGNQVVGTKTLPPSGYSPQIVRHMSPKQYAPTRATLLAKRAAEKAGQSAPEVAQVAANATSVENAAAPTAASAELGPAPVAQADGRVPQAAPQMAQRVQAIEYNPQPQYTTHNVPNRYGPPQQIVRRQRENAFGAAPQTVSNPVPPQRMAQQPPQRMMQQPPQRMPQQQMQMQPRAPQQMPQQAMRRGNQMQPQRAPQRGQQQARTGNPGEFEGATVHLGTTDRVVTAEEAQALGAGPPPQMPPERIVSDPDHVADPVRRPVQNQPRSRR